MSDDKDVSAPVSQPGSPKPTDEEVKEEDFTAPDFAECDKCPLYHEQLQTAAEQFAEVKGKLNDAVEEIHSLNSNIANVIRSFNQFKKEHNCFTHRNHELNRLRLAVDSLMNLGVPVQDLLAPENMDLLLQMEPSAAPRPFNNPLAKTPGVWGQMRVITPLDSSDPPALWSGAAGDYYITQAFTDYRLAFAKYLTDHRVFRCNACNMPLHTKFHWCLCMRCLVVPYSLVKVVMYQ